MTLVGRAEFDHPALNTAGGAGLHSSIETLWTNTSDHLSGRWKTYSSIANSTTNAYEHNFGVAFDELTVLLYTGTYPNLTKVESPSASGWTIAATSGSEKTSIDVTTPSSGGPHTFAFFVVHGRYAKYLDNLADVDLATTAPEDGQALVYSTTTSQWAPGASGDASFKIQSVTDPNAVIKGGYIQLSDGRELATYDGSGTASTDYGKDLTVSLDTILGGNPANATTYYLYIDLNLLGSPTTLSDNGRVLYPVIQGTFALLTTVPTASDRSRYINIGFIRSATSGTVWSGSGAAFGTTAARVSAATAEATTSTAGVRAIPNATIYLEGGSGHGSTNTTIRRFTTTIENINPNSDFTLTQSATAGDSVTINKSGVYEIRYNDQNGATSMNIGISLNSAQLTTSVASITSSTRLAFTSAGVNQKAPIAFARYYNATDVIRVHTDGAAAYETAASHVSFRITRVF